MSGRSNQAKAPSSASGSGRDRLAAADAPPQATPTPAHVDTPLPPPVDENALARLRQEREDKDDISKQYHDLLADRDRDIEHLTNELKAAKDEVQVVRARNRDLASEVDRAGRDNGELKKLNAKLTQDKKITSIACDSANRGEADAMAQLAACEKQLREARVEGRINKGRFVDAEAMNRVLHTQIDEQTKRAELAEEVMNQSAAAKAELEQCNAELAEIYEDAGKGLSLTDYVKRVREEHSGQIRRGSQASFDHKFSSAQQRSRQFSTASVQDELQASGYKSDDESESESEVEGAPSNDDTDADTTLRLDKLNLGGDVVPERQLLADTTNELSVAKETIKKLEMDLANAKKNATNASTTPQPSALASNAAQQESEFNRAQPISTAPAALAQNLSFSSIQPIETKPVPLHGPTPSPQTMKSSNKQRAEALAVVPEIASPGPQTLSFTEIHSIDLAPAKPVKPYIRGSKPPKFLFSGTRPIKTPSGLRKQSKATQTDDTLPTMPETTPSKHQEFGLSEIVSVDSAPQTMDTAPKTVDAAPQTVDAALKTVDAAPKMVDAASQTVDASPTVSEAIPFKGQKLGFSDIISVDAAPQPLRSVAKTTSAVRFKSSTIKPLPLEDLWQHTPLWLKATMLMVFVVLAFFYSTVLEERQLWLSANDLTRAYVLTWKCGGRNIQPSLFLHELGDMIGLHRGFLG